MKFLKDLGFNLCTLVWHTKLPNRIYYITLIVAQKHSYSLMCSRSLAFLSFTFVHGIHAFKVFSHIVVFYPSQDETVWR